MVSVRRARAFRIMKATDYHLWKAIPASPTNLFHRCLTGKTALEEIKKALPDWLRDFDRDRAEEEGPDYFTMARVSSYIDHETNPIVSFITHYEGFFTLDQIKHNGKLAGFREAIAYANNLMEVCRKAHGFKRGGVTE